MQKTEISWTDYSSNLLKYRRKSDGQTQRGKLFTAANMEEVEPFFDEDEARKLLRSKKLTGKRVFIDDMSDIAGEWVPDDILDKHFALFSLRPDVTFQVLTKRAERMAEYLASCVVDGKLDGRLAKAALAVQGNTVECDIGGPNGFHRFVSTARGWRWPLPNVWPGFSAENQECFDERALAMAPVMRAGWKVFVSAEPLLGPIDMRLDHECGDPPHLQCPPIPSWVIGGGESGRGARVCDVAWLRSLRDQCAAARVPYFCKQLGAVAWDESQWMRRMEIGDTNAEYNRYCRIKLRDPKGADMSEWPADMKIRQLPEA